MPISDFNADDSTSRHTDTDGDDFFIADEYVDANTNSNRWPHRHGFRD